MVTGLVPAARCENLSVRLQLYKFGVYSAFLLAQFD